MKKINYIVLMIITILLVGCKTSYYYNYSEMINRVVKIEIVRLSSNDLQDETVVIKALNTEEINDLISNLSDLEFDYPFPNPSSMNGFGIRITYNNNEYELIAQQGSKLYDKDGNEKIWNRRECSKDEFETLIFKYIE